MFAGLTGMDQQAQLTAWLDMTGYDNNTVGIDDIMEPHKTDNKKAAETVKNVPDTESTI